MEELCLLPKCCQSPGEVREKPATGETNWWRKPQSLRTHSDKKHRAHITSQTRFFFLPPNTHAPTNPALELHQTLKEVNSKCLFSCNKEQGATIPLLTEWLHINLQIVLFCFKWKTTLYNAFLQFLSSQSALQSDTRGRGNIPQTKTSPTEKDHLIPSAARQPRLLCNVAVNGTGL